MAVSPVLVPPHSRILQTSTGPPCRPGPPVSTGPGPRTAAQPGSSGRACRAPGPGGTRGGSAGSQGPRADRAGRRRAQRVPSGHSGRRGAPSAGRCGARGEAGAARGRSGPREARVEGRAGTRLLARPRAVAVRTSLLWGSREPGRTGSSGGCGARGPGARPAAAGRGRGWCPRSLARRATPPCAGPPALSPAPPPFPLSGLRLSGVGCGTPGGGLKSPLPASSAPHPEEQRACCSPPNRRLLAARRLRLPHSQRPRLFSGLPASVSPPTHPPHLSPCDPKPCHQTLPCAPPPGRKARLTPWPAPPAASAGPSPTHCPHAPGAAPSPHLCVLAVLFPLLGICLQVLPTWPTLTPLGGNCSGCFRCKKSIHRDHLFSPYTKSGGEGGSVGSGAPQRLRGPRSPVLSHGLFWVFTFPSGLCFMVPKWLPRHQAL